MNYDLGGAFIVGLMGAAHCFGMCGGLIGAMGSNLPKSTGSALSTQLQFLLSYNLGRVSSYALAGAIVGGSASALGQLFDVDVYLLGLRFFAGLMMIVTGLYIAQLWMGIVHIEKLGTLIWRVIHPLAKKMLPLSHPYQAVVAGMLWGWLPCGLVYSMLTWSVAAGSASQGALIMLAFGLGTLPALLAAGFAAKTLAVWVKKKTVRLLSGMLLIAFGLQTIYIAIQQST